MIVVNPNSNTVTDVNVGSDEWPTLTINGCTPGNTLFAAISYDDTALDAVPPAPTGWLLDSSHAQIAGPSTFPIGFAVYRMPIAKKGTNVFATAPTAGNHSGFYFGAIIFEVTPLILDKAPASVSAEADTVTGPNTGTLSTAVEFALGICGGNESGFPGIPTTPVGWTSLFGDNTAVATLVCYQITAATTALNPTWTSAGCDIMVAGVCTYIDSSPTYVVQEENETINAPTSISQTFDNVTGAGTSIVVALAGLFGPGNIPIITDDKANTYTLAYWYDTGAQRQAGIFWCKNPVAGVSDITINNGSAQIYGLVSIQEVVGITGVDQTTHGLLTGTPGTCTATMSASESVAYDYVIGAISTGNFSSNTGIDDPPAGYNSLGAYQDDSGIAGAGICFRVSPFTTADSIVWNVTEGTVGDPGVLVSFKGPGGTPLLPLPRVGRRRNTRQGGNVMGLNVKEWF